MSETKNSKELFPKGVIERLMRDNCVNKDTRISDEAVDEMNALISTVLVNGTRNAEEKMVEAKMKTIKGRHVSESTIERLILPEIEELMNKSGKFEFLMKEVIKVLATTLKS